MNCPNCNYENPDGSMFCRHCGSPLSAQNNDTTVLNDNQNTAQNPYGQVANDPLYSQPYDNSSQYNEQYNANYSNYNNQQYNNNQPYGAPQQYQAPQQPVEDEHVSIAHWIGLFCLNLIPCVGGLVYIIMMFVYAFGSTPKKSLKNFARAQLILLAIVVALCIVLSIILAVVGFSIADSLNHTYRYSYYY